MWVRALQGVCAEEGVGVGVGGAYVRINWTGEKRPITPQHLINPEPPLPASYRLYSLKLNTLHPSNFSTCQDCRSARGLFHLPAWLTAGTKRGDRKEARMAQSRCKLWRLERGRKAQ
jgi:hypothetical protein